MGKRTKWVFNPNAIRTARKESRIRAEEIADELNIEVATFYNYEKGTTTVSTETLTVIAYMTNKPLDYFFNK